MNQEVNTGAGLVERITPINQIITHNPNTDLSAVEEFTARFDKYVRELN